MVQGGSDEPLDLGEALAGLPRRRLSRRTFLKGSAAVAGTAAATSVLGGTTAVLRGLQPTAAAAATPGRATIVRSGHPNNCDGACGFDVHVVDGKVTMVEGAAFDTTTIDGRTPPAFPPRICLRGVSQVENLYSRDRIKYPYKRVGERGSGQWEQISWDQAITEITDNFTKIQAKYGPQSLWIAPYTGSLSIIEGVIGAGYRLASVLGASAGDFEGDNEGDSATPAGFNYVLVDPANPSNGGGFLDGHEYTDLGNAAAIFLWSNNLAETAIPDWRIVSDARARGTKLIVLDPRFTPTAAAADVWVPIRPGTDTALVDGMINYILANRLYDEDYVRAYTVAPFLVDPDSKLFLREAGAKADDAGAYLVWDQASSRVRRVDDKALGKAALLGTYDAAGKACRTALQVLSDTMTPYTPDKVAGLTDVPADQVVQLARIYATTKPSAIKCGWGLSHWYHGDLTYQALLTMAALTGNIGVHGGGVTTFSGALLTMAYDVPGWFFPDGKQYTYLPPMAACDAMLDGKPYPVRAAWFMVDNYAQQMSDRNKVVKALKSLDFLVVSDYVMSATADLADIVLPACTYLEKVDLMGTANYYLQYLPKVVEPLWESRSDLDAIRLVAQKMGVGQYFDKGPDDYIAQILHIGDPKADPTVNGLTWDRLHNGKPRINTATIPYVPFFDKTFPTKSGRIEFYVEMLIPYQQEVCDYKEPIEATPSNPLFAKYPLTFLSTHTRFRTHSQYVNLTWLKEVTDLAEGFLEINPSDAKARGIAEGDVVRVYNDRGEMKVRARLTEGIKPGVVNCYQGGWDTVKVKHYIEGHPNNLTHQLTKPAQALIPNFRSNAAYFDCLVQVERA
jgi:anaerobic selenocysteine-containing dehydrogenase